MATWADPGRIDSAPDTTTYVLDSWVGQVEWYVWRDSGAVAADPVLSIQLFRVADWLGYDIELAIAIAGGYQIVDWNSDQPQGTLAGTVTYPDGSVASGVTVRLYNRDMNRYYIREVITDLSGHYQFLNVPGGTSGTYYVLALDPDGGVAYDLAAADRVAHNATVNLVFGIEVPTTGLLWPLGYS
jgi:hypothetical protein